VNLPTCFELRHGFEIGATLDDVLAGSWDQPTIKLFGASVKIPRLTRWYGSKPYTYSGATNAPEPMPQWLAGLAMRAAVAAGPGVFFNSALLNYYRDGRDSVAWHSDDERELGQQPTIASLTLGAGRTFAIRRKVSGQSWRVELADGDLLIMRGEAQSDYQHAVPKTAKPVGPRVNITLRRVW